MRHWVVDTSVVAKWFLDEAHSEPAASLLDVQDQLHAPRFVDLELGHVLTKRVRRGFLDPREAWSIFRAFEDFPVHRYDASLLQDRALELGLESGQSIYDCLFVVLAELVDARLVTADRRLLRGFDGHELEQRLFWVADLSSP